MKHGPMRACIETMGRLKQMDAESGVHSLSVLQPRHPVPQN